MIILIWSDSSSIDLSNLRRCSINFDVSLSMRISRVPAAHQDQSLKISDNEVNNPQGFPLRWWNWEETVILIIRSEIRSSSKKTIFRDVVGGWACNNGPHGREQGEQAEWQRLAQPQRGQPPQWWGGCSWSSPWRRPRWTPKGASPSRTFTPSPSTGRPRWPGSGEIKTSRIFQPEFSSYSVPRVILLSCSRRAISRGWDRVRQSRDPTNSTSNLLSTSGRCPYQLLVERRCSHKSWRWISLSTFKIFTRGRIDNTGCFLTGTPLKS